MNDNRVTTAARRRRAHPVIFALLGFALCLFSAALAAEPGIETYLFPPELVMRHQAAIGLSDTQRQTFVSEVQALQSEMVPLQFELSEAKETLAGLLAATAVDEGQALAQADAVMALETRVKKRHLTLLVRIKNLLDAEQQAQLEALRTGG